MSLVRTISGDLPVERLGVTDSHDHLDGPSRVNHRTDWRTPESIERLATWGHLDQLLAGGDTTTASGAFGHRRTWPAGPAAGLAEASRGSSARTRVTR